MECDFSCTHIGDRESNLDKVGFISGTEWFVGFLVDGFKEGKPHYAESLHHNLMQSLRSLLDEHRTVTIKDIEGALDSGFGVACGDGKASIVIVASSGGESKVYHAGDTRAYFLPNAERTTDHTLAQKMIEQGDSPVSSLRLHPYRKYLTKSVDCCSSLGCLDQKFTPNYERLILCSDGFWSLVDCDDIAKISSKTVANTTFEKSLRLNQGKRDNMSLVYIEYT
jgi:serine/threonine protein phosphatase PrpC